MDITRISIDLAKDVFQIYGVNKSNQGVLEKRINSRQKFVEFIAKLGCCEIVMEACGSANHWARRFTALGCKVKLISPQYVKPYVQRNKNDSRDARAIMEASQWPGTPYVTPKTVEQQDLQSLLRIRKGYLDSRTAIGNQIRGLMKEYGIFVKEGYQQLCKAMPDIIARDTENGLSMMMKELLEGQYEMLLLVDERLARLDTMVKREASDNKICKRLQDIEGVGPITALAVVALVGDGKGFKNGRHFAAYLGLVPKQYSSGNRERLLGISKRGDKYLRELMIHGGRTVARTSGKKTDLRSIWINRIKEKGGVNKAAVAIANKNARIVMALLLSGEEYKKAA